MAEKSLDAHSFGKPQITHRGIDYENNFYKISHVDAEFEDFTKEYFVIEHGLSVGLVVHHGEDILLVRQYRLLIHDLSWEIPGGRVDENETPENAAIRECEEETGLSCWNLKPLLRYHLDVDINHNLRFLFHTDEYVESGTSHGDGREVVTREWVPLGKCMEMISHGVIMDSFTILALLAYQTMVVDKAKP